MVAEIAYEENLYGLFFHYSVSNLTLNLTKFWKSVVLYSNAGCLFEKQYRKMCNFIFCWRRLCASNQNSL
jgi:hypothetical protein